jgi:hypothetical protein
MQCKIKYKIGISKKHRYKLNDMLILWHNLWILERLGGGSEFPIFFELWTILFDVPNFDYSF